MSSPSLLWQELRQRLKAELGLKLALTILLNLFFYVPYGLLQRHHLFTPTRLLPGFLDHLFPFFDRAVWIYCSIFLLMPLAPLLMRRRRQLLCYAIGILLIEFTAFVIFFFRPTYCPRPDASRTIAAYRLLISVDAPLNAFPSLHAAFAVFSGFCVVQVFSELQFHRLWRAAAVLWTALILLGTLLTKQHTLLDIVAGAALGLAAYRLVFNRQTATFKLKPSPSAVQQPNIQSSSTAL